MARLSVKVVFCPDPFASSESPDCALTGDELASRRREAVLLLARPRTVDPQGQNARLHATLHQSDNWGYGSTAIPVSVTDSLQSLSWLQDPYRDVAAMPGFQLLSPFERWQVLCSHVEETRGVTGKQDRDALEQLENRIKTQLMHWLEQHSQPRVTNA